VVCTNGTARSPGAYAEELVALGFPFCADDVLTPASAAADLFARRGHTRVMTLGGDGLRRPLQDVGIETVAPAKGSGRTPCSRGGSGR
jgi:NagD protein